MKLAFTVIFVCLLLFGLFNLKSFKWLPTIITKLAIGALVLFFLNLVSSYFGLHIPINLFTSTVVGFCGIPGIITVASLFLFFL
ncbi:MAG TPA: pro-sigmaK processing inhibitor BofA [Bacilli bacterium]|uniref:pro-sigmaK processing inhibitor BofA family protein n=1 Tax=Amphibacillus indicireducens TaxID=1076330 RepID=UPI0017BC0649|nr:pro-sigmaK processing inhibitor BofA [Bacilli bacterium]